MNAAPQVNLKPSSATSAGLRSVVPLSIVAILLGPAYALMVANSSPSLAVTLQPLSGPAGWREVDNVRFDWRPHFEGQSAQVQQRFRKGVQDVDVYVAYYARQNAEAELIQYENRIVDTPWLRKSIMGQLARSHATGAVELPVRRMDWNGRKRLVVYWYWVDGQVTTSATMAKVLTAKVRLFGGNAGAGVVVASARYFDEPGLSMNALTQFVATFDSSKLERGDP